MGEEQIRNTKTMSLANWKYTLDTEKVIELPTMRTLILLCSKSQNIDSHAPTDQTHTITLHKITTQRLALQTRFGLCVAEPWLPFFQAKTHETILVYVHAVLGFKNRRSCKICGIGTRITIGSMIPHLSGERRHAFTIGLGNMLGYCGKRHQNNIGGFHHVMGQRQSTQSSHTNRISRIEDILISRQHVSYTEKHRIHVHFLKISFPISKFMKTKYKNADNWNEWPCIVNHWCERKRIYNDTARSYRVNRRMYRDRSKTAKMIHHAYHTHNQKTSHGSIRIAHFGFWIAHSDCVCIKIVCIRIVCMLVHSDCCSIFDMEWTIVNWLLCTSVISWSQHWIGSILNQSTKLRTGDRLSKNYHCIVSNFYYFCVFNVNFSVDHNCNGRSWKVGYPNTGTCKGCTELLLSILVSDYISTPYRWLITSWNRLSCKAFHPWACA